MGKRRGGGGEDPYIGVVMWRMKNIGTFVTVPPFKAVSYDRLLRKKCYNSTARSATRGVCAVYHHTSDDAMSLTFPNNVILFSLICIVNYTVILSVLEAWRYCKHGNYITEGQDYVSP